MPLTLVVTDGEQRAALATVRSLGAAGHRVHVVASRARSLSGASRWCASESVLPDPLRQSAAFASRLAELAESLGADVLLPVSEAALLAVLPVRARFRAAIPFPALERFDAICDKARVLEAARAQGIAVPAQRRIESAGEAPGSWEGRYPVVLKPSRSVVGGAGAGRAKTAVSYAATPAALDDALRGMHPDAFPVLLQQRIEGPGTAISVLLWEGEVRAAFAHRRIREKPPSGGVSVLRESIALDPALLARSVALLQAFHWNGVAMVEFKVDAATGTPYLMEINGRLWGSLQLAIDAGVDFPDLLVRAAMGERTTPVMDYRLGTRTRWEWGDVDHLLARLRRSPAALSLPPGAPGRLRTIADFLADFASGGRLEVFRASDVRPFLRETADWLRRR